MVQWCLIGVDIKGKKSMGTVISFRWLSFTLYLLGASVVLLAS